VRVINDNINTTMNYKGISTAKKLQSICCALICGLIFLGTKCEGDPPDDLSFEVNRNRLTFNDIKITSNESIFEWSGTRRSDTATETITVTMPASAKESLVYSPLVDPIVHMVYTRSSTDTIRYETKSDERDFHASRWGSMYDEHDYFHGMFEGVLLNVNDATDTLLVKNGDLYFQR
jgi:hypothetical protein